MKKMIVFVFLIVMSCLLLSAQTDSISLIHCLSAAKHYAAINNQRKVMADIAGLRIANANATYFPTLSAYGKAWYQSDAIRVVNEFGPVIEVDQFQYNAGIEANQILYNGGITKHRKELEQALLETENGKIDVELYKLNSLITELFFNSIFLRKNTETIQLKIEVLDKRSQAMEAAFNSGIIKRNDLDKIQTELLLTQQQLLEIEKRREQAIASLALYTGLDLNSGTVFTISDIPLISGISNRPEYKYFDAEIQRLETLASLQKTKKLPVLAAYGQAGYSYPGLNFFENEQDYYYIVGARLSWALFDWKQNERETQVLLKQREIIETNRTDFERKISIAIQQEVIEQQKIMDMVTMDEELINRLASITRGSETALLNGVITSTDYLEDLNAEIKARLDCELHKMDMIKSTVQYILLKGFNTEML